MIRSDNVIKAIFTGVKKLPQSSAETIKFKSMIVPIIVWIAIAVMVYQWGMTSASY